MYTTSNQGTTPAKAISKLRSWFEATGEETDGFFYAEVQPNAHPLRRYAASYVKGKDETITKAHCVEVERGIWIIKN
jgi:hypothetical protein